MPSHLSKLCTSVFRMPRLSLGLPWGAIQPESANRTHEPVYVAWAVHEQRETRPNRETDVSSFQVGVCAWLSIYAVCQCIVAWAVRQRA